MRLDADDLGSITRVYATNQKDEHQRYKSIYDANAEEFAMVEQMQRYVPLLPLSSCPLPDSSRLGTASPRTHGITGPRSIPSLRTTRPNRTATSRPRAVT